MTLKMGEFLRFLVASHIIDTIGYIRLYYVHLQVANNTIIVSS